MPLSIFSLPSCLLKEIYRFIPLHNLYCFSKSHFIANIKNYYNYHKTFKRGRFFYSKVNNTYIRYLIRNDMSLFLDHFISSNDYVLWEKIKRYTYKNTVFKTYLDYCIFLANDYGSEKSKQLLMSIHRSKKKR